MKKLDQYIESTITLKSGVLNSDMLEECGCETIMSDVEDELMLESAKILGENGGSVLNVGFGMGIFDKYVREYNPSEHCIIEVHPTICEMAQDMGFNPICGKWEDVIPEFIRQGKKFDNIYFDTYTFDHSEDPQWGPFSRIVPQILNDGGIYSYFNEFASKIEKCEEIIDPYGWEKNIKMLTFERGDYELIWYRKR